MNAKIIFFDDEPQTGKRLKNFLMGRGFEIITPQNVEEAFAAVEIGADLLVHCAHSTKTYWGLCQEFFKKHHHFPSMHFSTGASAEEFSGQFRGPMHLKMRHLLPEKFFLKRAKKLIFIGRLFKENKAYQKIQKSKQLINSLIQTTEIARLPMVSVQFFKKYLQAEQVYFLNPGGFEYYVSEMWKVKSMTNLDEATKQLHKLISAQPAGEADLSHLLQTFASDFAAGWQSQFSASFAEREGKKVWFWPVVGPTTHNLLGTIIIVNPSEKLSSFTKVVAPEWVWELSRHWEYLLNLASAKSMSYIDDLTDLYNQRYLQLVLDKEINRSQRSQAPFSVLFMDIDHFKKVNDTRGHLVGSRVLVEISKIIHKNVRTIDYGFRYGGDEFMIILVGSNAQQSHVVAERIRKQVEEADINFDGENVKVTISIGVASYPEHAKSKEEIIVMADKAMYYGKNKSRNVVYVAS